jgi:glycosyltransferase involved in cell wall biosynthesis
MHYSFLLPADLDNPATLRMRRLGAAMIDLGVQVSYILNDTPLNRTREAIHPRAHVEFVPPRRGPGAITARRRAIATIDPDYVEVLNPHPKTLFALAAKGRRPRVVGLWDEPPIAHALSFRRRITARLWHKWLLRRAWLKLVATHFLLDLFRDTGHDDAVYLPHVTYLTPPPHDNTPSPFTAPTAVYMGAYWAEWDHDIVFQAAKLLKERGKTPPICLVGGGPEKEKWQAFLKEHALDNVTMTGFLSPDDMWRHLRNAQVLLFPMRENLLNKSRCSSKLFAYAQAARPIVASQVGEVPYVLGENNPIWTPATPQAFAEQIEKFATIPKPPDVDYHLDRLSPATRAKELLEAIRQRES